MPSGPRRRFFFISSIWDWGGSEELWSAAAAALAADGHEVTVFKRDAEANSPHVDRLRARGCRIRGQTRLPLLLRRQSPLITRIVRPLVYAAQHLRLYLSLRFAARPELIILSQGGNFDGLSYSRTFRSLNIPYVLIIQKATDLAWPADEQLERLRALYAGARACFFVSDHNRCLTEEQLGMALPQATVVRNPFLVPWEPPTDWPDEREGLRLACVARMYPMEKGQDLLLRVMARQKWRNRQLSVTFYGKGANSGGLEEMAAFLRLTNVSFAGFVNEVADIWGRHHGLILPSRCEGLPLVIVEAMLSCRIAIVTDVGGNREVVDDETTGFLAAAPTEDALDEAMERAWKRRHEWSALGAAASARIRLLVPSNPAAIMAATLVDLAERSRRVPQLRLPDHPRVADAEH